MRLKQHCETVLFLGLAGMLRRLPMGMAMGLAEAVAVFVHRVLGWRKSSTRERIREVFPEASETEWKRIRLEAVRNLARNATELIRGPETLQIPIEGEQENLENIALAREQGRGVIVVIAHSGNWDLAAVRVARPGHPVCFIARKQKNEVLYEKLNASRQVGGSMEVDRDDPRLLKKVIAFLKEKNGVVAILVDIRARSPGETFQFLGHPASLTNGLGALAARSGATVIPVYVGRKGRTTHFWKAFPSRALPAGCKDKEQRRELLQSCLDDLSGEILSHPECYFWFNKRWVLEPFT